MKGLKKIVGLVVALLVVCIIASCSNANKVKTELNVASRNNKLTLVATFTDENEEIFSDYTPYAYLYEMDEDVVGDMIESLSFSLDDDLSSGNTYVTDELVFDDLSEQTNYTIRITATIDGRSYTLLDNVYSTSNLGSEEDPIKINTKDEFLAISDDREAYYTLESDIDFAGEEISPLFTSSTRSFEGGFDGNGHTISNFTIESNNQYNGLFGVNNGEIKNLTVSGASISSERTSESNTGLLVGYNTGVIDNVTLNNCTVTSKSTAYTLTYDQNVGGLVGLCGTSSDKTGITNCTLNDVTVTAEVRHQANVGGVVGEVTLARSVRNTQTLENDYADVTINVTQEIRASIADDVDINVGGFAGFSAATFTNCFVDGAITVNTTKAESATYENGLTHYNLTVGGFAGNTYNNVARNIENIGFAGSIDVDATPVYETYIGGLIGVLGNNFTIKNAVSNLTSLTIKGPQEVVEEEEVDGDTTEGEESSSDETSGETSSDKTTPEYTLTYSTLVASISCEQTLKDNNIINYNNNLDPNVSGFESYLHQAADNKSTNLETISDFIKNYLLKK